MLPPDVTKLIPENGAFMHHFEYTIAVLLGPSHCTSDVFQTRILRAEKNHRNTQISAGNQRRQLI